MQAAIVVAGFVVEACHFQKEVPSKQKRRLVDVR